MSPGETRAESSRETRLLLLMLALSVAVLLLLARFRFPEQPLPETRVAQPLERLAVRATYDELAGIIAQLESRIAPSLLVLRVSAPAEPDPFGQTIRPRLAPDVPRFVPAIRIGPGAALALLEPGARVQGIVGNPDAVPVVLAHDAVRNLAFVRVPSDSAPVVPPVPPGALTTPRYVAVAEGTRGGPTFQPLFLGRTDPIVESRWNRSLLSLGGTQPAAPGSLVYTLEGMLAGMVVSGEGTSALVTSDVLLDAGSELAQGRIPTAGDIGIEVQPLTPGLAAATNSRFGSIVSFIEPTGPARDVLQIGDVIDAVNGQPMYSAENLLIRIARTAPGNVVRLRLTRQGEHLEVPVTVRPRVAGGEPDADPVLGLTLRAVRGVGSEVVRVAPLSLADRAGLMAGDIIVQFSDATSPSPREIETRFQATGQGGLLVGVDRRGRHMVLALTKP